MDKPGGGVGGGGGGAGGAGAGAGVGGTAAAAAAAAVAARGVIPSPAMIAQQLAAQQQNPVKRPRMDNMRRVLVTTIVELSALTTKLAGRVRTREHRACSVYEGMLSREITK